MSHVRLNRTHKNQTEKGDIPEIESLELDLLIKFFNRYF